MVGAGGTGSIFISHLCRIWQAWVKLGGSPFEITLMDDDVVSEANLARQVFCEADIGAPKAAVLAQRARSFYGIPITPVLSRLTYGRYGATDSGIMLVGCVDNLEARRVMRQATRIHPEFNTPTNRANDFRYWLDMGNLSDRGQVILGGRGLPDFFDLFPSLLDAEDPKGEPSCSMSEALEKQDLFINSTVAVLGAQLIWQMMRRGRIAHHGFYVNLTTGRTTPIPVPN